MAYVVAPLVFLLFLAAIPFAVIRSIRGRKNRWVDFATRHNLRVAGVEKIFDRPSMSGNYQGTEISVDLEGYHSNVNRPPPCLRVRAFFRRQLPSGIVIRRVDDTGHIPDEEGKQRIPSGDPEVDANLYILAAGKSEAFALISNREALRSVTSFLEEQDGRIEQNVAVVLHPSNFWGDDATLIGLIDRAVAGMKQVEAHL